MPISYAMALKLHAKETGHFLIPKKGSEAYEKVKKIQQETEMTEELRVKRKVKTEPKMMKVKEKAVSLEKVAKPTAKKVKGGTCETLEGKESKERSMKNKAVEMPPSMKNDTSMIDVPGKQARKRVLKDPESIAVVRETKGVNRSGKTLAENDLNYLENSNIGEGQDLSAQLPGQKEKIEKALKKKPVNKLVTVGNGEEKTIDGLKSEDVPSIEGGNVQFSFQALRNRLMC